MIRRRGSTPIRVRDVVIGGGAPISVQSMTITDTRDARATLAQIQELVEAGCDIVRVAVPDKEAAEALKEIRRGTDAPLVADIHFDHRLALLAAEAGVDCLRINPGNIGGTEHVQAVVQACKERQIPIRIGVNAGSVQERWSRLSNERPTGERLVELMVEDALQHVRILEDMNFDQIKISLKSFDVPVTVEAYKRIAQHVMYPFHIGITESGTPRTGIIRSSVGIGALLYDGYGDTMRVSLTTHPVEEVFVANEILKVLELKTAGPTLVSCPSCGRCEIDLFGLADDVEQLMRDIKEPIKVAVMGCVVNGPGEARDADIGIAGGKGRGVIFKRGEVFKTVDEADMLPVLTAEIRQLQ
ncbi:MAG: flavodoxin-dependent (E)-4-hydroxy-3-methylbut-2-enyl-diphosphate synthase, partial [Actinobacteria bacterium]|nr:flavodoxin-dependent (E)-4-hydroxy-3-methylbut-2-enyl-diphosphate synthase [Actinomycetota bacterium]